MDDAIDRLEGRTNGQVSSTLRTRYQHSPLKDTKASPEQLRLTQVLLGIISPSAKVPVADLQFFDSSLNPSQREAVKFALESPEVACIHGPPGNAPAF
jgi:DNA polymerase alpha-associated DNA helicase A